MRLLVLVLALSACRDRRPPLPPCSELNANVTDACPTLEPPMVCETASEDLIRCVDGVVETATECRLLRQALARCSVKFTE